MTATTHLLRAILNRSWRQHPTKQQLYGHLPPITKTIQIRRTRHAGHCWRNRDDLISDVHLWTTSHGRAKTEWPARTYIQQLCKDTGCSSEDLSKAMNDREKCRERVRDIRADGTTRWWWLICPLKISLSYLPTPPLRQDMTQGQFLSGVYRFEFSFPSPRLVASPKLKSQSALLFTHSWRENNWIHTFPKGISAMWNAISLVQDLNSCRRVHFLRR